jgi:hypothetical protein
MKKNPLNKGMIMEHFVGFGEISGERVSLRAKQIALIADRPVTGEDHEQALRELTGGPEMDDIQALLESIPEEQRWDPVPRSSSHQPEETTSEDEDEEGRNESAQLFEEGVSEAKHDQMLQAALDAKKKNHSNR